MDQRRVDDAIDRHLPRLSIVALAFCASAVTYVVVGMVLVEVVGFEALAALPRTVATAIAVSQLLVILAGYLVSRAIRTAAPSPQTSGAVNEAARDDAEEAMQRYTRSVIVASALREVAAVVGLVLTLLTGELLWVLLLSAAATISMVVHWPRRDAVQDYLEQQRVAR